MGLATLHFLAKNEGYGALIFFIIWALVAIVSQIQKWQEAKRKQQQSSPPPPPRPALPRPVPLPGTRQMSRKPQRPQQPVRTMPKLLAKVLPKAPPPLPPKTPREARPVVTVEVPRDAYEATARTAELSARMTQTVGTEQATAATRAFQERPAITAQELSKAMRPQMLRRSFILTELLAPPVGLRDLQSAQERGLHERAQRPA